MATELFLQLHQLQEAYRSGAAEIQQLEAELERLKSTEAKYRQDASEYDESYTKLMFRRAELEIEVEDHSISLHFAQQFLDSVKSRFEDFARAKREADEREAQKYNEVKQLFSNAEYEALRAVAEGRGPTMFLTPEAVLSSSSSFNAASMRFK